MSAAYTFSRPLSEGPLTRVFAGSEQLPFGRRLRSPRGARIPVVVVTGFLGAGKTTLIRELLARPEGANTLVVVNEFGAIGIDDAILRAGGDTTVLLGNGCLCCSLRSDLQVTLRDLFAERGRGELPHFERIIIETSGLADPVPILQTFIADRSVAAAYHLTAMVTVVDAVVGGRALEEAPEARRQAAVADKFVVTKADLARPDTVGALKRRLAQINPAASIHRATNGLIEPGALIGESGSIAIPDGMGAAQGVHSENIVSFALVFEAPLPWDVYEKAMALIRDLRGADILRVKGLLAIEGCRGPIVVHQVQHQVSPPVEFERWPDEKRTSRLVFITRGLAENEVGGLFRAALRLAGVTSAIASNLERGTI